MFKQANDSKPNGFIKQCRECDNTIYLHRGQSGPWRAYEPQYGANGEDGEWNRHRCAAALQDAEMMSLLAPAAQKPADLIPRMRRMIQDLQGFIEQVEARNVT